MDPRRILAATQEGGFVRRVECPEAVDSTNAEVRRLSERGAEPGTVVIAGMQTDGRGRLGRHWHSPAGLGLYLSVLLRPREPAALLSRFTLVGALAAARACREVSHVAVDIKWPNDLVHDGRKLGGVLAELRSARGRHELVLGVGIDVGHDLEDFPPDLRDRVTSLRRAGGGATMSLEALAESYLGELGRLIAVIDAGGWPEVRDAWTELAPGCRSARVAVVDPSSGTVRAEGVTAGIDDAGALRVVTADGVLTAHLGESIVPRGTPRSGG